MPKSTNAPEYTQEKGFRYALMNLREHVPGICVRALTLCVFPKHASQKARSHTRAFFAFWDWPFGLAQNAMLAYGACAIFPDVGGGPRRRPHAKCGRR